MCYEIVGLAPYVTGSVHEDIKCFLLNPSEPTEANPTVTAEQYALNYNLEKQISKLSKKNHLEQDLKIYLRINSIMYEQN